MRRLAAARRDLAHWAPLRASASAVDSWRSATRRGRRAVGTGICSIGATPGCSPCEEPRAPYGAIERIARGGTRGWGTALRTARCAPPAPGAGWSRRVETGWKPTREGRAARTTRLRPIVGSASTSRAGGMRRRCPRLRRGGGGARRPTRRGRAPTSQSTRAACRTTPSGSGC